MSVDINKAISSTNIAEDLDEDLLVTIGDNCSKGYASDLQSRSAWEDRLDEWTKLALQIAETKTYPWPGASNVKYPLLTTAAMQFAARAYPSLVPSDGRVVKCKVVGADPEGRKTKRAQRVSTFMSYQVLEEMNGWEEETDRLLMVLPIVGCVFKKTYYDPLKSVNCSYLVYPKDFVVNYWTKNLENAARITQVYQMNKNEIKERVNSGLFLDVDLGEPSVENAQDKVDPNDMKPAEADFTTPYTILEQHTWLDLDEDEYAEPYIVTFEKNTKKVLRIVARYTAADVMKTEDTVVSIKPTQYYTKFGFIPNPEGGFYDIGFGLLLGSINESVNTLINQLVDAGSLANLQSGFLAKGLRVKLGETRFQPGEWKFVNATMDDIKKGIFPLPTKDPSSVLFQLLGTLIQSGKELASVAEIFVGKMPGQNTPATTTQATIEQGMKLFTAIFKRIFRSMTEEFRKLYILNSRYYDVQKYVDIVEDHEGQDDLRGSSNDIVPAADPAATTDTEKKQKADDTMNLIQLGTVNPQEATKRFLEARNISDIQPLMTVQQQGPSPQQVEMQMEQQKHELKMKEMQGQAQVKQQLADIELKVAQAKLEIAQAELAIERERLNIERQSLGMKAQAEQIKGQVAVTTGVQKLQFNEAQHQQKLKQAKEKPTAKE